MLTLKDELVSSRPLTNLPHGGEHIARRAGVIVSCGNKLRLHAVTRGVTLVAQVARGGPVSPKRSRIFYPSMVSLSPHTVVHRKHTENAKEKKKVTGLELSKVHGEGGEQWLLNRSEPKQLE